MANEPQRTNTRVSVRPYAFIVGFGLVSMLMDTVYEGALAVQGPLLAGLGANAFIVGLVSGLGEATALAGRLFSGPLADRTGRYWTFAILGYAATACAVPAMGFAGSLLGVSLLIIFERFGKSLRTPSRDAMISHAAGAVGRGKGFALHEVMDQIGAVAGPLIVAALLSATANDYRIALGALVIPGLAAICVLLFLRHKVPNPAVYEKEAGNASAAQATEKKTNPGKHARRPLPRLFWLYTLACALMLTGVATFGVISYHLVSTGLADDALVPVLYAVAMGVDGLFAAITGVLYDRLGTRVLLCLPFVCALIPFFAYTDALWVVIVGIALWGVSLGIQESTMRAAVADMIPIDQRATAYGMFSVCVGVGNLLGGVIAGGLYTLGIPLLIGYVLVAEAVSFVLLFKATRTSHTAQA
ncbi:MAG: MFS transporter [Eggerthellaceae bacterium]|jgi:MFS family permease